MKICCFLNHNPFYRLPIFTALSETFNCDFFFNACVRNASVSLDPSKLKGYICHIPGKFLFSKYVFSYRFAPLLRKRYTHYLLSGDSTLLLNWFILLWAKLSRRKVFFWTHGLKIVPVKRTTRIVYRLFYKYADGIFLYGQLGVDNMLRLGCNRERLYLIHNSLDSSLQTTIYNNLSSSHIYHDHFGNSDPTIIYIGRLQKRKRVDMILSALSVLLKRGVQLNLTIVGSTMDDDSLPQLIQSLGISDRVWMFGESYDETKNAELLYNACVCVSPGNVGLTCIHSLSYGTPVVSHGNFQKQMPEYEAIINDVTGSFFKENDVNSLADEITKWVNLNTEKRNTIREAARKTVEDYWSIAYQLSVFRNAFSK